MSNDMRKLSRVPYGTPQHAKLVKKLQSGLNYNDYILCMKGVYDADRVRNADSDVNLEKTSTAIREEIMPSDKLTVYADQRFYFVNRNDAEYNLEHRQVNVGLLITDKIGRVLIARKKNGHASIVGGHTDFNRFTYTDSVLKLMNYNLCKEYREEVVCDKELVLPSTPSFFITEGETIWDFFHCWYVYVLEVDNLDDYKFKSGEKNKHVTEVSFVTDLIDDPFTKNSLNGALKQYVKNKDTEIKFKTPEPLEKVLV